MRTAFWGVLNVWVACGVCCDAGFALGAHGADFKVLAVATSTA
jgi:hypothetical protein